MVLTILQLRSLLPKLASVSLTSIHLFSVGLTSTILWQMVFQHFLCSTLAPFSLLLLSLLASYVFPFLLYIGLGPNIALFFFCFFLNTYFSNISSLLQSYWFILLQGTLRSLYSLFRHVLIYFIILKLRLFYVLYIAVALIYSYSMGRDISFLLKQCCSRLLIPTYYTLEVGCLEIILV